MSRDLLALVSPHQPALAAAFAKLVTEVEALDVERDVAEDEEKDEAFDASPYDGTLATLLADDVLAAFLGDVLATHGHAMCDPSAKPSSPSATLPGCTSAFWAR